MHLIEQTYRQNGDRPVHLVGHSNGPIYVQYLLTHTSAGLEGEVHPRLHAARRQLPGPGARLRPDVRRREHPRPVVPRDPRERRQQRPDVPVAPVDVHDRVGPADLRGPGGRDPRPVDGNRLHARGLAGLFEDAGIPWAIPIGDAYIGGVPFADPAHFPNVDVYAEKGSGIETLVGLGLTDLTIGQQVVGTTEFLTRDGDVNQEDLTNDAVAAWAGMTCHHFSLTDNPGVTHFELPSNPGVLARLIANANAPRSNC